MIELSCETEGLGSGTSWELPKEAQERWEKEDYWFDDDAVYWFFTTVTVIGEHEKEIADFVQDINHDLVSKILDDFEINHEGLNNIASFLSWNDSEHAINHPDLSRINIVKRYDGGLDKLTHERVCARFKILHSCWDE